MPWCGNVFVPAGTLTCPNGSKPTTNPNGAAGPSNTSTVPVTPQAPAAPPSNTGQVWGPRVTPAAPFHGSADASARWANDWTNSQGNTYMSQSAAETLFGALPEWQRRMFNAMAAASTTGMDTGESVYKKYVAASAAWSAQGKRMTPAELALQDWQAGNVPGGGRGPGGGDSYGSGGSGSGPSTSVRYDNAPAFDVRAIADGVAQEMLGRVVTDEEMKKILKRVRKYENRNPSVTTTTPGAGATTTRTSGGATTSGRQEVVERLMAQNPDFIPYQMDHTVYDAMLSVMKQGEAIANG